MNIHEKYMSRCLQLAVSGAGYVAPNPMVGAVLVHDERIIGEGSHAYYGGPHAEVNCIASVAENDLPLVSSSVLYVSLEPCAHYGKTPPCADLIIEKKIPEVVVACRDPFPQVNGKGIEKLREAGVKVTFGVLEKEAIELNCRFFTFHQKHRPYVILKWAQTADEKMASPGRERLLISNIYSNRLVHRWRSEEAAIMIGTYTALKDDPSLTNRYWPGKSPVRLVIDRSLKLPDTLHIFDRSVKTIIFNTIKQERKNNLDYILLDAEKDMIPQMMDSLYNMNIQSVLVEGGAALLGSFIRADLWDDIRLIVNTGMYAGEGLSAPELPAVKKTGSISLMNDRIDFFKPVTSF